LNPELFRELAPRFREAELPCGGQELPCWVVETLSTLRDSVSCQDSNSKRGASCSAWWWFRARCSWFPVSALFPGWFVELLIPVQRFPTVRQLRRSNPPRSRPAFPGK
jgi:hypothetical protein